MINLDKEQTFVYNNLTRTDVSEYAEEEIELILSRDQGGLYAADTDQVIFEKSQIENPFKEVMIKTTAFLYCKNPMSNELELIKSASHNMYPEKYDKSISELVSLYKLLSKNVPSMYIQLSKI